jgi:hypothetical protein
MSRHHKGVEYYVDQPDGETFITKDADQAAGMAIAIAMSGRPDVTIDVIVLSVAGARAYGGDDAVKQYREDPETSVFDRIIVRAESQGRVP